MIRVLTQNVPKFILLNFIIIMTIKDIKNILAKAFINDKFEVFDVNDDNNQFSLIIISDKFINLPLINRHKMVYRLFAKYLTTKIHALQIKTYTKLEWKNNNK